jgi:hypothetical protein
VPRNRGPNTTTSLSSMTVEGMGPSLAVEGATDREVFEAYVEKMLAPSLQAEQVVVMDNLSAHKGERVRALVEERGAQLSRTCRPTLRTSTPSKKPSPRSRVSCAKPRLEPARLWWRRWDRRSRRSALVTRRASSSTVDTVLWFDRFDGRCRPCMVGS